MKKFDGIEKEDEGGGGLLANPDLALQVFRKFTLKDWEVRFCILSALKSSKDWMIGFVQLLVVLGEELSDEPSASLAWHCCSRRWTGFNQFVKISQN